MCQILPCEVYKFREYFCITCDHFPLVLLTRVSVFTCTAAACSLQVVNANGCCFLEDSVTGNVYDLSPLGKGPDSTKTYFSVKDGETTYDIQVNSSAGETAVQSYL